MWRIYVPLSLPALATLATFAFLYAWNSFVWPFIVISTGNKTELALGYCTLYGDMCGGLAATAAGGIGSDDWTGIRVWVVALPFLGAALVDFGPLAHRRVAERSA